MSSATLKPRTQPLINKGINWVGLQTLIAKEVRRFAKVYWQTIVAPVVTTIMFYLVFSLAFGHTDNTARMIDGVPYMTFLIPGLLMMGMAQNAFANTSSSLIIAKVQGSIVDVLMPPLSASELLAGYIIGGLLRGLAVGFVTVFVMVPFAHLPVENVFIIALYAVLGCTFLALLGLLAGIWSEKFDHMAAVTNFVIMPLTMLSGTFYSVDQLSPSWQFLAHLNPFFYMNDGFRSGFIGRADMPLLTGIALLTGLCVVLWAVSWYLLKRGYKIRT